MNPARSLVGGDRPGCDFMITTLGERRAGTSTGCLMLAVLVGLADVERDLIRTHTAEGRSRAKLKGKHMGRPPSLTPEQQKEATRRRAQGATLQELADSYDRSISTMRRATRVA
jgi:DNA invertase Pin-like site-specific DNA recombinase